MTDVMPVASGRLGARLAPTATVSVHDAKCVIHLEHRPKPAYLELHHIVPRGWQYLWQPDIATVGGDRLWHPQTVALCRTGHGNVHYAIMHLMHAWAEVRDMKLARRKVLAELRTAGEMVGWKEYAVAQRALDDWVGAGGSLEFLVEHGEWGGI